MFLSYAVHYPQPDKVDLLAQRMRDCSDVMQTQPGLIVVDTFRDATNGTLLALALWERMPPRYPDHPGDSTWNSGSHIPTKSTNLRANGAVDPDA